MRRPLLVLAMMIGLLAASHARAETVGPSFSCTNPPPKEALAVLTCLDPALAHAEISFVETYYVLRQKLGPAGSPTLKADLLTFISSMRQTCRVPPTDQPVTLPANAARCVEVAYNRQRAQWTATLTGVEAEEAGLAPEQFIALQQRLLGLGFLPPSAEIDGIYGIATRDAITTWQRVSRRPETGFLSFADARALLSPTALAPSAPAQASDPPVAPTLTPPSTSDHIVTRNTPDTAEKNGPVDQNQVRPDDAISKLSLSDSELSSVIVLELLGERQNLMTLRRWIELAYKNSDIQDISDGYEWVDSIWPYLAIYIKPKGRATVGIIFHRHENELFLRFLQIDGENREVLTPADQFAAAVILADFLKHQ